MKNVIMGVHPPTYYITKGGGNVSNKIRVILAAIVVVLILAVLVNFIASDVLASQCSLVFLVIKIIEKFIYIIVV